MTNGRIQKLISVSKCAWEALNLSIGRSETIRGSDFDHPSLVNDLLIGNPGCLAPKTPSLRSWASLGPAQGTFLVVTAVALQKPSGKCLQKLSYLFKKKKKSLSLHLLCWLNPSGKETSAPAVAGWSLCWTARAAITKHCEVLKLNLLWDWNRAALQQLLYSHICPINSQPLGSHSTGTTRWLQTLRPIPSPQKSSPLGVPPTPSLDQAGGWIWGISHPRAPRLRGNS